MSGIAIALLAANAALPTGDSLAIAWLRDGRVVTPAAAAISGDARVPLGSLWKLFVYAYVVERGAPAPDYRCGSTRAAGEEYCCEPGQAVDRDRALVRSCGLFFEPRRLRIDGEEWAKFWSERTDARSEWLRDLEHLQPKTELALKEILFALDAAPPLARSTASQALLATVLDGYGHGLVSLLGGTLRVKTFTWAHPERPGASLGGGAGWLADGTPVWFAASGASRNVLQKEGARLATWLPALRDQTLGEPCVVVDYFERYPLHAVDRLPEREAAAPGPLRGRYRVLFENKQALVFQSDGELQLQREPALKIRARLHLDDYIARVLEREADPTVTEAARALAVVARTWLLQNAPFEGGCFHVKDSTRAQRVSPNPPSRAAQAAALFTDGLVLKGQAVRYHRDQPAAGVLSWSAAVERARQGARFDAILAAAFPAASLTSISGEEECRPLPDVEAWLARMRPLWQRRLASQPGFEPPTQALRICRLDFGNPYADRERLRLYVRGATSREDRISIAHEYVHLAFQFHPNGRDERFVEDEARSLLE